jgi:hypothetical protein
MKFIAILSLIALFALSYSSNCEDQCKLCQKVIYSLKFNYKVNCGFSHCKNTCYKVITEWSKPGSVFDAFQSDSVGKCDACFRGGLCKATECEEQKREEQRIIEQVINQKDVKGKTVNSKHMDNLVKNVLDQKQVDFTKVAKKVRKEVKKALKKGKFDARKKNLTETLRKAAEY